MVFSFTQVTPSPSPKGERTRRVSFAKVGGVVYMGQLIPRQPPPTHGYRVCMVTPIQYIYIYTWIFEASELASHEGEKGK